MTCAAENRMLIGKRIRELREKKGFFQDQLSEMVETKRTNIANYETGTTAPQPFMLVRLAKALNTTVDYLVGATDDSNVKISDSSNEYDVNPDNVRISDELTNPIEISDIKIPLTLDGQLLTQQEIKLITTLLRTTRS